jgi:hypothetical protein
MDEITVSELKWSKWIFPNFIPFSTAISDRYHLINLIGTKLQASVLCFLVTNQLFVAPLPEE